LREVYSTVFFKTWGGIGSIGFFYVLASLYCLFVILCNKNGGDLFTNTMEVKTTNQGGDEPDHYYYPECDDEP